VRTLLRKFKLQHYSVKKLLFFVHLRSRQKRTEEVIFNYQIYSSAVLSNGPGGPGPRASGAPKHQPMRYFLSREVISVSIFTG